MDKRYYVANNIVTYFLGEGRLDFADRRTRFTANAFANALAGDVGDGPLLAYAGLAKKPSREQFETFILELRNGIHAGLRTRRDDREAVAVLSSMDEAFSEVVVRWLQAGIQTGFEGSVDRFVQEPDTSPGGHRLGLLPQVQSFCNLLARLNKNFEDEEHVTLVHDEQKEFRAIIEHYLAVLASNEHSSELDAQTVHAHAPVSWRFPPDKFRLTFGDSARSAGIQVADIVAGFCRSRLDAVSAGRPPDRGFDSVVQKLEGARDRARSGGLLLTTSNERIASFMGVQS